MPITFRSIDNPCADVITSIAALDPANPFATNEYAMVRRQLGAEVLAIVVEEGGRILLGCLSFLTRGRMNSRLEVTSLPKTTDDEVFWQGLFDECRIRGISVLSVNSFASAVAAIPDTRQRVSFKKRGEYAIDLTVPDLSKIMNRRHRRQISAARSAGLEITRVDDGLSRDTHVRLSNLSLDRRRRRGESIDAETGRQLVDAFLDCHAGQLFQAVRNNEVYSSLLIAKSRSGAYGQSSGTSEHGREIGASHFVFSEAAALLQIEGLQVFNLGGADEHSGGLQEFKLGMGATRVELESAEFFTGNFFNKVVTRAASLLRG